MRFVIDTDCSCTSWATCHNICFMNSARRPSGQNVAELNIAVTNEFRCALRSVPVCHPHTKAGIPKLAIIFACNIDRNQLSTRCILCWNLLISHNFSRRKTLKQLAWACLLFSAVMCDVCTCSHIGRGCCIPILYVNVACEHRMSISGF